ncbi:MAG: nucleoside phosphorylase [Desulfocapsaceae bacterium]|nr:nucleoside phosphorylase [Desulfocapsaceae bacterium]
MSDDIIIHPLRTRKDEEIPTYGLLFVNPGEAKTAVNSIVERGGRRSFIHNSNLAISAAADFFVAGPAIGAPSAVLLLEKLIVLGAKKIVLVGWCGSIDRANVIGDLIVPRGAVCGEGTSPYYSDDSYPLPSAAAVTMIKNELTRSGLTWKDDGRIWSTDAPYRESRKHLQRLNLEEDVVGVDMEFSALCTVGAFRGIEFAAVLVVSDELFRESWRPGFKEERFRKNCRLLMDCLLRS